MPLGKEKDAANKGLNISLSSFDVLSWEPHLKGH
jgi:hypothetical protein